MRTLVLMRHAKTEPVNPRGDRYRRLTARGRADAADAGHALVGLEIDQILCSTAVRTRETVDHLGLDAPVEHLESIYGCGVDELVQVISEADPQVRSLLVVGHNPTVGWLSSLLAASSAPAQSDEIGAWFPTAAFAQFEIDGDWADLPTSLDQARFVAMQRISQQS